MRNSIKIWEKNASIVKNAKKLEKFIKNIGEVIRKSETIAFKVKKLEKKYF